MDESMCMSMHMCTCVCVKNGGWCRHHRGHYICLPPRAYTTDDIHMYILHSTLYIIHIHYILYTYTTHYTHTLHIIHIHTPYTRTARPHTQHKTYQVLSVTHPPHPDIDACCHMLHPAQQERLHSLGQVPVLVYIREGLGLRPLLLHAAHHVAVPQMTMHSCGEGCEWV